MSLSARECPNEPAKFHELVGAHGHHVFAVFDDLDIGEEAIAALRFEGFDEDEDIWVFCGEEGSKRLDLTGRDHGIWARVLRLLQYTMSNDFKYLRTLDEELHGGHLVVAVRVKDPSAGDEMARLLHSYGGHSIAYSSHWDFMPTAA